MARLSKTTLEEFYKTNIWNPLGMIKSTYHPTKFRDSIVLPYLRDEVGELKLEPLPVPIEAPTETAGHGVWSTPNDYVKLLGALLDGGGPILSQKSVDEIFTPQCLNPGALMEMVQGPYKPALGPSIPVDQKIDHGLAGLINHTDFPGRRPPGVLQWSGMPNLIWVRFSTNLSNLRCVIDHICVANRRDSGLTERRVSLQRRFCSSCQLVTPSLANLMFVSKRPFIRFLGQSEALSSLAGERDIVGEGQMHMVARKYQYGKLQMNGSTHYIRT